MINNKQIKEAKPGRIKIDTPGLQIANMEFKLGELFSGPGGITA